MRLGTVWHRLLSSVGGRRGTRGQGDKGTGAQHGRITASPCHRVTASFFTILLVCVMCSACEIGHGLGPEPELPPGKGRIAGTVTFGSAWPELVAEVRVVVYAEPLGEEDPPSEYYVVSGWSEPILMGAMTHPYDIILDPGVYGWVILVWRPEGAFWNFESLAGTYYAAEDTSRPGSVLVRAGETAEGVDILGAF